MRSTDTVHPRTTRSHRTTALAALLAIAVAGVGLAVAHAESRGYARHAFGHGELHGGPSPLMLGADSNGDKAVDAAEWSALFAKLDADHDGKIVETELPGFHAPPPEALAFMIAHEADADDDGTVTAAEWQARVAALDTDKDGALSTSELSFRHHLGDSAKGLPPFAAQWDTNHDGLLQAGELDALFAAADEDHDGALTRMRERHRESR
jgi:Ca2+-binding EF-hand superfamily protein